MLRVRPRVCSRTTCTAAAAATLTYAYADSTAVVGPLALRAEPGSYDLCAGHARTLQVPRGWEVIRLPATDGPQPHSSDDLLALADAIREVGLGTSVQPPVEPPVIRRKGHLAVLADL